MRRTAVLALFAAAATTGASKAAVLVVGNTSAHACYEAAEYSRDPFENLPTCDRALTEESLTDRDRVATLVNRGILKFKIGAYKPALTDLDAALQLDPKQPEAFLNKGVVTLRQGGHWSEAQSLFDQAIALQTVKPALAYLGRGMAREMLGDVQNAYRDYRTAAELAPGWSAPAAELKRFTVARAGR